MNDDAEIGSGQVLRFRDMLTAYAQVAGLRRRRVLALPVPAPRLSGFWITMTTPIPRGIAMPLAASMAALRLSAWWRGVHAALGDVV